MRDLKFQNSDIEKIIGEPIKEFSVSPGASKGDNVAGSLFALQITTNSNKKLDLVYKAFPEGNLEQTQFVIQFGIFRTEACMYEKVFPRIEELLMKRENVKNKQLPVPKYISGFNDDKSDYVCLEDVRPQGFIMQDKFHSLTRPEVALVMKEIARFHALTYFLLRYEGERMFDEDNQLRRIRDSPHTVENPMLEEMGSRMFHTYMGCAVDLLKPRSLELAARLQNFLEKNDRHSIHKLTRFNTSRTDKTAFACIVHGDLWTNNILFKYSKDGDRDKPTEVKFIDFQQSRRGNLFEDLGYFFWTSTTPEFRKSHLDAMLSEYYISFEETLKELAFPKPENFTRGYLIDEFHRGILNAYAYMPFALSLQLGDLTDLHPDSEATSNDGDDPTKGSNGPASEVSVETPATPPAAIDFDQMMQHHKKMTMLRMENSPRALQRLEDLTREVVNMNLL